MAAKGGRRTDLKLSNQLSQNGGLYVIIGYPTASKCQVEAQIEGRVARSRSGQPGSFQFVVCLSAKIKRAKIFLNVGIAFSGVFTPAFLYVSDVQAVPERLVTSVYSTIGSSINAISFCIIFSLLFSPG